MTMHYLLTNEEQAILLSDRKLTGDPAFATEDANKAAFLDCKNARLAVGYAGLAVTGDAGFYTAPWLWYTLRDCWAPDCSVPGIIDRFKTKLTDEFLNNLHIRRCPPEKRLLTVAFSGYLDYPTSRAVAWIVSNFQTYYPTPLQNAQPWDYFTSEFFVQTGEPPILAMPVGDWMAWSGDDHKAFVSLLTNSAPVQGILGKGIELMRDAADRKMKRTIGYRMTSIVVPRLRGSTIDCNYFSTDVVTSRAFQPALIRIGDGTVCPHVIEGEIGTTDGSPISGPKVRMKNPCPCRSGKKFKHCHGRPGRSVGTIL